ncbi:MAG: hypothetical protein WA071_29615 [Undibacterium umbellatum]|uniref:HNH endonuclease n=1 Tax=Undibacterium umbellatum TaxID=2762300 RepID=UPI003BB5DD48
MKKSDTFQPKQVTILHNRNCVYCGKTLGASGFNDEHVIGRKFVPKGSLNQNWNLILNACIKCNNAKSKLEDDISAISMHPDVFGRSASEQCLVNSARKSVKSVSRRTGKKVAESEERWNVEIPFSDVGSFTFGFVAPPQIDDHRAFELARMHIQAFFFLLTFDESKKIGHFWPGIFLSLNIARHADWGNELQIAFMQEIENWNSRINAQTANDHFKVNIRKHPDFLCWSWSLEWNQSLRLIGLFGDDNMVNIIANTLPFLDMAVLTQSNNLPTRYRQDVPLKDEYDTLFIFKE